MRPTCSRSSRPSRSRAATRSNSSRLMRATSTPGAEAVRCGLSSRWRPASTSRAASSVRQMRANQGLAAATVTSAWLRTGSAASRWAEPGRVSTSRSSTSAAPSGSALCSISSLRATVPTATVCRASGRSVASGGSPGGPAVSGDGAGGHLLFGWRPWRAPPGQAVAPASTCCSRSPLLGFSAEMVPVWRVLMSVTAPTKATTRTAAATVKATV